VGDDDEASRNNSVHDPKDTGKRDSPVKHARSVDIRDLYEEAKTFDGSSSPSREKSKTKKLKDSSEKSLVSEYFKKLTKTKIDDDDDNDLITATPKQKAVNKKGTMKKAELKVKPATTSAPQTTTKDNNKTYTRIPSPEPSDLGETHDDSLRSISVDDTVRIGETDATTPRSLNSQLSDQTLPSPIKIMAIPEEGRHSDDETATPSADELTFTPNPLSDGLLLDSRPLK